MYDTPGLARRIRNFKGTFYTVQPEKKLPVFPPGKKTGRDMKQKMTKIRRRG